MKLISIIIPVLNEEQIIGRSLELLRTHSEPHEVIVVDGGSRDETVSIVNRYPEVKCLEASQPGRGHQMNMGAQAAVGDILLFLHADTFLPRQGLTMIHEALSGNGVAAGSFYLSFDHGNPFLRFFAFCSRINLPLFTYGDQGYFMTREIFKQIGGFAEMPLMEDVEIHKRLRECGRFKKLSKPVVTSARRFLNYGIVRQQILNTILVFLYHAGISPYRLKRFYL